jgi:cytidylate kinase
MPVITISRQEESLGDEIAVRLSQKLNMDLITRETIINNWLPEIANEYELRMLSQSPKFYLQDSASGISFKDYIQKRLKETAEDIPIIVIGLGAHIIFSDSALNIKIMASDNIRILRTAKKYQLSQKEAENFLKRSDRKRKRFLTTVFDKDWMDLSIYNMILNTDNMSIDECTELISRLLELKVNQIISTTRNEKDIYIEEKPVFKHSTEEEFARILDMYNIQWEYEPRTFPVEWDAEGNVKMAFTPDFYLPKFNTYIELTTMEQKYVTKKNKKARRLRELYGINISLVYKKDFYSLINRFGKGDEK